VYLNPEISNVSCCSYTWSHCGSAYLVMIHYHTLQRRHWLGSLKKFWKSINIYASWEFCTKLWCCLEVGYDFLPGKADATGKILTQHIFHCRLLLLPPAPILNLLLLKLLIELSPSWGQANCAATQEFPQHFMEPEGSLPWSQEPSTGPYPEPYQSNPYNPIHFNIVHPHTP
jgi:hypothetical protein